MTLQKSQTLILQARAFLKQRLLRMVFYFVVSFFSCNERAAILLSVLVSCFLSIPFFLKSAKAGALPFLYCVFAFLDCLISLILLSLNTSMVGIYCSSPSTSSVLIFLEEPLKLNTFLLAVDLEKPLTLTTGWLPVDWTISFVFYFRNFCCVLLVYCFLIFVWDSVNVLYLPLITLFLSSMVAIMADYFALLSSKVSFS